MGVLLCLFVFSSTSSSQAFSLLTYNASGNGATDWSTNAPQVQAIGRQMLYLQPDIVTFNEIPFTNTYHMPSFVKAYLPAIFWPQIRGRMAICAASLSAAFPLPGRKMAGWRQPERIRLQWNVHAGPLRQRSTCLIWPGRSTFSRPI